MRRLLQGWRIRTGPDGNRVEACASHAFYSSWEQCYDVPSRYLWTGGWDSTFRVLDLVVRQQKPIQPYYVINTNRKSLAMELQTIVALKNDVRTRYPASEALLAPVMYVELSDIRPNRAITEAYERLVERGHLGSQYEYLSRFADQFGLTDIELCIEQHSHAWEMLKHSAVCQDDATETVCRLSDAALATDLGLFRYCTFPLPRLYPFWTIRDRWGKMKHLFGRGAKCNPCPLRWDS